MRFFKDTRRGVALLWAVVSCLPPLTALATPDFPEPSRIYFRYSDLFPQPALSAEEAFARTQAVLKHFGVPEEEDQQPYFDGMHGLQTATGIARLLPFLDPKATFRSYSLTDPAQGLVRVFQDPGSRKVDDFTLRLSPDRPQETALQKRLQQAALNPVSKPLSGLRIAIDPGHMGGDTWDERTRKFVVDPRGRKLSEGVLALQVALLLERRLLDLGAEVLLTRRSIAPVTDVPYEELPLRSYALNELRQSQAQEWFQKLLEKGPAGSTLFRAFEKHPETKRIFSPEMRSKFFILGADLDARADLMQEWEADLVLVIHFDTMGAENGLSTSGYNGTKVYVPGAFQPTELATRKDRRHFARHLADPFAWEASVKLSRSIVSQLKSQLAIPYDAGGGGTDNVRRIEPGVYARNLHITRRMTGTAISYLECLFYNAPAEFAALSDEKYPLMIDGINRPYSARLLQVVEAIQIGLVRFVAGN